jgi:hypothetical protein
MSENRLSMARRVLNRLEARRKFGSRFLNPVAS